jgi:hypothetical protein
MYACPLPLITLRHSIPWPLNQAMARLRKLIIYGFCSSVIPRLRTAACRHRRRNGPSRSQRPWSALLPIAGDAVTHLPEPGHRLDFDVDQVARPRPFVPLYRWFGIQIEQAPEPPSAECPVQSGEWRPQQTANMSEVEPLATELHGVLPLLRIERLPLGAADARSARKATPQLGNEPASYRRSGG